MESLEKPKLVDKHLFKGNPIREVNFNIVEENGIFTYETVDIPSTKFNYSGIVDALISYYYPNDVMQAVINNYLLEPENEYYVSEFNKMQSWRKEAKEIAKEVLLYELH